MHNISQQDFQLFEATPGKRVIFLPDSPAFTIIAATEDMRRFIGRTREQMVGKSVFDAFPSNPEDIEASGHKNLRDSLEYVIKHKAPHQMAQQRYDVTKEDGSFNEIYWQNISVPVLDEAGEVKYIIHIAEDITEKVKAVKREEKIKGLEQAYGLFMQAPFAIHIFTGPDLIIDLANPPTLELWGKTEEVTGKRFLDVLPELKGQGYDVVMHDVMQTGMSRFFYEVPLQLNRPGKGPIGYFNFVYQPYYKEGALKAESVLIIAHEVTEQVLAKKSIEESEERYHTLLEETTVATAFYTGPDIRIQYANATMLGYWGKGPEVIGKTFREALPELGGQPFPALLEAVYTTGNPYTGSEEKAELRIAGELQTFYFNFTYKALRDRDGQIYAIHHTAVDVTEQVMARQKLEQNEMNLVRALEQARLSKEAAELGTFDMDLEKGILHWDERCRTLFGINHNAPVTYEKDFADGLHPEDRGRVLRLIDRLFIKSISNGDYDVEYRTVGAEDGVVRWVRAKGKVYFNEQDKPLRFIGSVLDITEKVMAIQKIEALVDERTRELAEANETLHDINKELQRSNANLEEFAHAASHDLKEPVRKIHYFTQHLKQQLTAHISEGELRSFGRIENATERMGALIDDLLLYSHVSHRPHETESVDLNEKVQRVLEDLELDIHEKRATIKVGKLPIAKGYARQLQQLFQNLISNALKYSKADAPPQIDITAEPYEQDGKRYYLIRVRDNGIGFDQQHAEKIFQMFARLHGKHEYSGTGVGLSIVKKVVENHHGHIKVESTPGKGSTFSVLLPTD